jgi:hypothetical protein
MSSNSRGRTFSEDRHRSRNESSMRASGLQTLFLAFVLVVLAVAGEWFLAAVYGEDEVRCEQASVPAALPALPEASGVAASRRTPGLVWAINDSGPAILYGLSDSGEVRTRVQVSGASITDWEDISLGRCAGGTCVYIADIGDNNERRSGIRLYRVPEPAAHDTTTSAAEVFEARYPDHPHDAEAAFVTTDGTVYVVTKDALVGTLYRFPALESGKLLMLQRVATLPASKITDADASSDGAWIAVRNHEEVVFYRTSALLNGDVEHGAAVRLTSYGEAQGEGVTFADRGTIFLASEGGGKKAPGSLLQLRCSLPTAS